MIDGLLAFKRPFLGLAGYGSAQSTGFTRGYHQTPQAAKAAHLMGESVDAWNSVSETGTIPGCMGASCP